MSFMVELIVSVLLLVGAAFALVGSIGLLRLPDLYSRLHGPTKATTLGVGSSVVASAVFFSAVEDTLSFHEPLVLVFLFMTAPVSAHLMAKSALHMKLPNVSGAADALEERRPSGTTATEETGQKP